MKIQNLWVKVESIRESYNSKIQMIALLKAKIALMMLGHLVKVKGFSYLQDKEEFGKKFLSSMTKIRILPCYKSLFRMKV